MKITKYEHACMVVEDNGEAIIIDPGMWTTSLKVPENVVGIIVTHAHQDHLSLEIIEKVTIQNPNAQIIAHGDVLSDLDGFNVKPVAVHETLHVGGFELEFFGGEHAPIRSDWPTIANLGVLINKSLYYPGDSFAVPEKPVNVLALPISAPWLKFSEVAEFLLAVHPNNVFPVHDAILSDHGKQLLDTMTKNIADTIGANYRRIDDEPLVL